MTLPGSGGGDIGFRWNKASGSYELVADLDLWQQPVPVERFLARLTQQYALRSILLRLRGRRVRGGGTDPGHRWVD